MHAAGEYVYQTKGGDGLPRWAQANRNIENRDVVLWYTVGVTHIPRPERLAGHACLSYRIQVGTHGFFDRNPALDVPRNAN